MHPPTPDDPEPIAIVLQRLLDALKAPGPLLLLPAQCDQQGHAERQQGQEHRGGDHASAPPFDAQTQGR